MGSHSSADDLLAGVESDAIRAKARKLAAQMNWQLSAPGDEVNWFDTGAPSDLVEWCRSARDVLEAVGRG